MWNAVAAQAWSALAQRGQVYVPGDITEEACDALYWAVLNASQDPAITHPHLWVNTNSGVGRIWDVARLVEDGEWDCTVRGYALSAGLALACACSGHRRCYPRARFLFHGEQARDHAEGDAKRAQFYAQHTSAPEKFWLEKCEGVFEFGAEEALELGVMHEILDAENVVWEREKGAV